MMSEHTSLTGHINTLIQTGITTEQADILIDALKQCLGREDMNETVANNSLSSIRNVNCLKIQ